MKILITFFLVVGLILSSCRKEDGKNSPGSSVNVYAAGYVYDDTSNTATYWKNGVPTLLPPKTFNGDNSFAYAMAVSGNDVYVAGTDPDGPVCWKNGVPQRIPGAFGVSAMTVSGKDVYIGGNEVDFNTSRGIAVYWKNFTPVVLSEPGIANGVTGIAVVDTNVYACGKIQPPGTYGYAMYWKNGKTVQLTSDTVYSAASGIVVVGKDVYISGWESTGGGIPVYWKNGLVVRLANPSLGNGAGGIAISGSDVYVIGDIYNQALTHPNAVYWKNGQIHYLTDPAADSRASAIVTIDGDVYIGGMIATPKSTGGYNDFAATYWRDGVAVTLPYMGGPGYRYVFAMAVTPK